MSAGNLELHDYLIHEGEVEGKPACALLWTGRGWPLVGPTHIRAVSQPGGFQDLWIEPDEGDAIILKSLDKRLLSMIVSGGLYVIYPDESGDSAYLHLPPAGKGE